MLKGDAVIYLQHTIYKNFVSSAEVVMGMCIEQCTFQMSSVACLSPQNAPNSLAAGAKPQTPLGQLTVLHRPVPPDPLDGFKGTYF